MGDGVVVLVVGGLGRERLMSWAQTWSLVAACTVKHASDMLWLLR